ncbi:hypothetical protein PM082_009522 [Marasmius tenuissimus]|nr:hypothetical protein PM082_009522 [Marasmius tenuissimus]
MSASLSWYIGADCTGGLVRIAPNASTRWCDRLSDSRVEARSIRYDDVPNTAYFFISEHCTGSFNASRTGSGCATAPDGFLWKGVWLNEGHSAST